MSSLELNSVRAELAHFFRLNTPENAPLSEKAKELSIKVGIVAVPVIVAAALFTAAGATIALASTVSPGLGAAALVTVPLAAALTYKFVQWWLSFTKEYTRVPVAVEEIGHPEQGTHPEIIAEVIVLPASIPQSPLGEQFRLGSKRSFLPTATLEQKIRQLFPSTSPTAPLGKLEHTLHEFLIRVNNPDRPMGEKLIERTMVCKGQKTGIHRIERYPVIMEYMAMCLERIRLGDDVERNIKLLDTLCRKFNVDYDKRGHFAEWCDPFYFRYIAGSDERDPFHDRSYEEIANDHYVMAPVNFRGESLINPRTNTGPGLLKCGVFTDLSNGLVNLKELKEMAEDPSKVSAKLAWLNGLLSEVKSERAKESIRYTIKSLKNLPMTTEKRRKGLEDEMLLLLWKQLVRNNNKVTKSQNGGIFSMAHVGLLNEKTQKIDEGSGWAHYENNAMLDMAEIFKEFKNKPIFFDKNITAPRFVDGKIYMPYVAEEQPDQLILNTLFFNISPQGYTENEGEQRDINDEGMKEFTQLVQSQQMANRAALLSRTTLKGLNVAKEGLEDGDSSYKIASNLTHALVKAGVATSEGCSSCKDRGGASGAEVIAQFHDTEVDKMTSIPRPDRELHKRKIHGDILKEGNPPSLVVYDANGSLTMKVAGKLPGVSVKSHAEQFVKLARMKESKYGNWPDYKTKVASKHR